MSARVRSRSRLSPLVAVVLTLASVISGSRAQAQPTAHHPGQWTTQAAPWPGRDTSFSNGVWAVHMALVRGDTLFARPHSQVLAWGNWSPTRPNGGGVWGWRATTDDAAQAQLNLTPIAIPAAPPYDLFCAGHAALPDGDLLVISGTERGKTGENQSARFDSNTRQWLARQMHGRRWYGNATPTLVRDSARILATAGNRGHHMVVFGGKRESDGALTNDVRRYLVTDDGTWDPPVLDPTPGVSGPNWPDEREFPSLTESGFNHSHLFGGRDQNGTRRDVWQLNRYSDLVEAQNWTEFTISNPSDIPSRWRHVAVVAPGFSDTMYVFGGERISGGTSTTLSDFWQLQWLPSPSPGHWEWVNRTAVAHANGVPSTPRSGHTAVYDRKTFRMFMFGGQDANGNIINDANLYVITFTDGIPSCQIAQPTGASPAPRTRHAMAVNHQVAGQGVLFGGLKLNGAASELSAELWEFTVTTGTPPQVTWTQRTPAPGPAPRMDASVAVFTEFPTSYVVIGGELDSQQWDSDIWELRTDLPNQWQQHHPTGSPPSLRGHRAISDEDILTEREPEIYTPETDQWSRFGQPKMRQSYHMIFHAADGKLYSPGPNTWGRDSTWRFDPATETWSLYATNATTPLDAAVTGILYRPDQLMKASGPYNLGGQGLTNSLVTGAAAPASWRASVNPMARPRTDHTLNMLPTGEVIATGGLQFPEGEQGQVAPPRKRPEIWDPTYSTSSTVVGYWYGDSAELGPRLAPEPVTRGHHSSAVILPDGRILSGGGYENHPLSANRSVDQYSPPYLFKPELQGGGAAVRPQLLGAQDHITWGQPFKVACPDAVAAACLIRPGASTHAYNHDVRYVPLELDPSAPQDGHRVTLRFPAGSNYHTAPSGNYLLFVLKNDGGRMVPSVARWVNVGTAATTYATWDVSPPTTVMNLYAAPPSDPTSRTLTWSSPSDAGDGSLGRATRYELRYRAGQGMPTPDDFFTHGVRVDPALLPTPATAGTPQGVIVTGLDPNSTYYFRLLSRDGAGSDRNWSTMSNEVAAAPPQGGCPFVDTRTAGGWQEENSILGRSLTGALSLDGYRLRHAPDVTDGRVLLRVRENEQERTTLDQVRLVAVDHVPGLRAWAVGGQVLLGTRVPAARVTTSAGADLTAVLSGAGEGFKGEPGDTLLVEFATESQVVIGEQHATQHHEPFHIDDGDKCPPDCGYPLRGPADPFSTTGVDAQVLSGSGIQIQRPDGLGGWRTVVTRYPREHADDAVLDGLGHGPVRLVFVGRHRLRSVGRVSPATGVTNTVELPLLAARHSRLGNVAAALDTTGDTASELVPGDTVSLAFGWVPVPEGHVRELLFLSHGVYTANQAAAMQRVLPERFAVRKPQPNPFASSMVLQFDLPNERHVRLEVFDAQGRRVRTVANHTLPPGTHALEWDGFDESGGRTGAGVYFYRLEAGKDLAQGRITRVP